MGSVVELFAQRKGEMVDMQPSLEVRWAAPLAAGHTSSARTQPEADRSHAAGAAPFSQASMRTPRPPPHFHVAPQGTTRIEFKIATRGLLGLKNSLLTATRGMGLLNTIFDEVGAHRVHLREAARALPA